MRSGLLYFFKTYVGASFYPFFFNYFFAEVVWRCAYPLKEGGTGKPWSGSLVKSTETWPSKGISTTSATATSSATALQAKTSSVWRGARAAKRRPSSREEPPSLCVCGVCPTIAPPNKLYVPNPITNRIFKNFCLFAWSWIFLHPENNHVRCWMAQRGFCSWRSRMGGQRAMLLCFLPMSQMRPRRFQNIGSV